jgi:hypothetical protein
MRPRIGKFRNATATFLSSRFMNVAFLNFRVGRARCE